MENSLFDATIDFTNHAPQQSSIVESLVDKVCQNISQLENCMRTENKSNFVENCEMGHVTHQKWVPLGEHFFYSSSSSRQPTTTENHLVADVMCHFIFATCISRMFPHLFIKSTC